jgi:hypothetical protein
MDRHEFDPSELELRVTGPEDPVVLGQLLEVSWTMTNRSGDILVVPGDVSLESQFAMMTVTDPLGRVHRFNPIRFICDTAKLAELRPGDSVSSSHRVFWSTSGFAFPQPGTYRVTVAVTWSANGIGVAVTGDLEQFIDFPTTSADNEAARLVLNDQVGMYAALGGGAQHLTEAVSRLQQLSERAGGDAEPRLLAGFRELLPS